MPTTRSKRHGLGMLALILLPAALGGACSGKFPAPSSAASCGDQCVSMSCPAGTHCLLSDHCAAHCEPDPLSPR